MVPFVHYIPVDAQRLEEDLPAKLAWARAHDDEAKQIALNAKAFPTPATHAILRQLKAGDSFLYQKE